jgi:hypothetical protein
VGKFLFVGQTVGAFDSECLKFLPDGEGAGGVVVFFSEVEQNVGEVDVFLLHFLVMAATLLSLPGADEQFHSFEDFVSASHVAVHKVLVVDLEEPVISSIFLGQPVTVVHLASRLLAFFPFSHWFVEEVRSSTTASFL